MIKKYKNIMPYICLILLIAFTLGIFSLSMDSASESSEKSRNVVGFVQKICDLLDIDVEVMQKPIRKAAHFAEFAILGVLSLATARSFRLSVASSLLYSLIVATVDETIQRFSPERYSSTGDVLLDFAGALFGVAVLLIIIKIKNKRAV